MQCLKKSTRNCAICRLLKQNGLSFCKELGEMGSILWDSTEIFQVPRQTITACLKKLRKVCLHWSGSFESTPKNQVMSVHVCQQLREISSKNSFLKFTKNIITLPQKICYGTPNVWCKITIIQSCEKVQVWTKKRIFLMLLAFKCANFQQKNLIRHSFS